MLCCRVACSWCLWAIKFARVLIPPLALVLTSSLFILLSQWSQDHAHFPSALHQRICQCTVYSQATVGVFLITDERLKGRDNQLPLNCPYPFLSLGSSHLLGLLSQVYFLFGEGNAQQQVIHFCDCNSNPPSSCFWLTCFSICSQWNSKSRETEL